MAIKFFAFFFRQSVLSDVFGLNGRHAFSSSCLCEPNDAVRAVAVAKRREYMEIPHRMQKDQKGSGHLFSSEIPAIWAASGTRVLA